jgi:hypothetical protein
MLLHFISFGKKIMVFWCLSHQRSPAWTEEVNPSAELALKPDDCELGLHIHPLQSRSTSFFTLFDGSNKLGYIKQLA